MGSSAATTSFNQIIASVKPSPRTRRAAQLYGSGIAKTKKEAAEIAGIHPGYLTNLSNGNSEIKRLIGEAEKSASIAVGDINQTLIRLGREGLATIDQIRRNASSEAIQLKAAIDLADRSPETSKVQKHQVESLSLDGEDVERLTKAMVESARIRADFAEVHEANYVKVTTDLPAIALPLAPSESLDEELTESWQ